MNFPGSSPQPPRYDPEAGPDARFVHQGARDPMATSTARLANQHRRIRRPAPPPVAARPVSDGEKIARGVGAAGLLGIGLIHLLDVVDKFDETFYLGVLYVALIGACLVAARQLILVGDRRSWFLAGGLAAATLTAYAVSRTVGLPASN